MPEVFQSQLLVGSSPVRHVVAFHLDLRVSRPAEAWVDVLVEDAFDADAIVGSDATLSFGYGGDEPRRFGGVVESVTAFGVDDSDGTRLFNYRLVIVHPLALTAWSEGHEIFQDLDTPAVLAKVLEAEGLSGDSIEMRLTATYPKHEFCVRYDESVLAFVNRWCEQEGIHYFWELTGDSAKLVFADDSSAAAPIDGEPQLKFVERSGMVDPKDSVSAVFDRRRVVSGKFVLRDFHFETPKVDLTGTASADVDTALEIYDYPGLYGTVADGKRLAQVRLECAQVERHLVEVEGDCTRLHAGRKVELTHAEHADANAEHFVVAVSHHMSRTGGEKESGSIGDEEYGTSATLLPLRVKFRAPRLTPWPVIEGPQTAMVVCPAGAQAEEIHTDQHARAKVKFHWDLAPAMDDKASAWFRVGQMQTSGSMILPRLGWEVIVEFLEGNPDRPVVTGKLYNGVYMPPYALPEGKTRTSIQSASTPGGGGKNEIRLEDKAGGEEIMIHSQYDTTMKAANNKTKNVGNNETASVKVNRTLHVGASQEMKISKASKNDIGGSQTVSVGAVRKVEVNAVSGLTTGGNASTTVGAVHFEMDGNPLEALIALAVAKASEIAAEKAAAVAEQVHGAVMGKVNQVLGPVQGLVGQAQKIGGAMAAVAGGDLGATAGLLGAAASLPGAGALTGAMGGGGGGDGGGGGGGAVEGGPAATTNAGPGGEGSSSADIAAKNILQSAMTTALQKGIRKGGKALSGAVGGDSDGGGGGSEANANGPEGAVASVDGADNDKGPGHQLHDVAGSINDTIGALKVVATAEGIMCNAAGSLTDTIGAARAEIVLGNRAESVEGMKSEKTLGLIIVSKADETEKVGGAKTCMVGGAIVDKITGGHSIESKAPATFIGAFHKVEAKTKITLKCGASTLVIDGGGITIESPMVMITAGKIVIPKAVTEV